MMEGNSQNHEHLIFNKMLLRNVFKSCNADLKCDDYADEGYSCANAWNCNDNNTIITGNLVSSDRSSYSRPLTTFSHNLLTLLKISL